MRRALWLLVVASGACAEPRTPTDPYACTSWTADIAPLFAERCAGCHTGAAPAGAYDTTSYLGALGPGSDAVPNAIAGRVDSALLATLDPARADGAHRAVADAYDRVREWVVDCELSYVSGGRHAAGNLNPADPDFHGALLARSRWNLGLCQSCHGADFAGGSVGAQGSCLSCHQGGPTACTTCHGAPPATGSHPRHDRVACDACHVVPATYAAPGHVAGGAEPPRADVSLAGLAALTPDATLRRGPPTYDPATRACDNVYCHGDASGDAAATRTRPVWGGAGQAECGACHGLPPRGHDASATACAACHGKVVDAARQIVDRGLHANGAVDVEGGAGCSGCHGGDSNAAPPRAVSGATSTGDVAVGAHQSHVAARHRLRGPLACGECHVTPRNVSSPGHLDDGPAEVTFASLAIADGAAPVWDRARATCAGAYCHGGGRAALRDAAPGLVRSPRWTAVDAGEASCGKCHGLPPVNGVHPAATLTECAHCHPDTVDRGGAILISGETSKHMNGIVDVP